MVAIDVFFIYLIFKKKFNYKSSISLISFFAVLSFHLIWLVENNYITLTYALHRTGIGNDNFVENHLLNPLIFLGKQVVILIPFFIMASLAVSKFKVKINLKDKKLIFLIIINAVPIILMLLTSLIFGIKIRTMWMTPFYLFLGVLFVYIFQKKIIVKKLKYFISIFFILFIFSPTLYSYISITQANKRTDYPGKEIAKAVETKWVEINKQNENKINKNSNNIIGWDEWYAGNLSYNIGGKVFLEKFVDQLFEGNNDNNILITKSNKAKQVCELDPLADIYLINYFFTHDHHVCFMNILK